MSIRLAGICACKPSVSYFKSPNKFDLICILTSSAIRISRCIGLHRLESDTSALKTGTASSPCSSTADVVSKEVENHIWCSSEGWGQVGASSIAARGVKLARVLCDLEQRQEDSDSTRGGDLETEIGNAVRRRFTAGEDQDSNSAVGGTVEAQQQQQILFPPLGPQDF
ncbi:hypothetical protein CSOJ01_13571 [Colletotrichum sojae]|uniref:Uncharacterized protein n=1 Tax=Colletotrichum sojae TaxID=2175907 RepID=A0A8H6ISM0_9PEZI|nr:hypothetical protein CSOJ01_13571 [Colletotrichum sojae]